MDESLSHKTLRRIGSQFLQMSVHNRISTLVVHAKDADRAKTSGPPKDHWLRGITGIGKPTSPPAFLTLAVDFPHKAVYFGGGETDPETISRFMGLCDQVGSLFDQDALRERVPPAYHAWPFRPNGPHPDSRLLFVLLMHEIGQRVDEAAGFSLDRSVWDDDGWQPHNREGFYFTYSRNSFEDAAAAIDVLLAVPARDTWLPVPKAARVLQLNPDHVGRLVKEGKIRGRGTGRERRVSPSSIIEYILAMRDRDERADAHAESDADVERKFRDLED